MSPEQPLAAYAYSDALLSHDMPEHPENADRLRAAMSLLRRLGVLPRLTSLPFVPATEADIALVHDPGYLAWLRQASVDPAHMIDQNTYLCASSYDAAAKAVGGAIACVEAVVDGSATRAIALLRPPGHHARPSAPIGFCLLNNLACAAAYAIAHLGVERILAFDFDVHHGNGTQEAFYEDPRLLYVSLHQWPLFPMSGAASDRGGGAGAGYTVNVPLPAYSGDDTYALCVEEILVPAAHTYSPDLILVSAGYDAHWRDPLAGMLVTAAGFDRMTRRLLALADELCDGRIAFFLEGGYDAAVGAACLTNLCAAVAGLDVPFQDPAGPPPEGPADDLDRVRRLARGFGFGA